MRTSFRAARTIVVRTIAAAAPLTLLLGAAPGRADQVVYYHAGNWQAFTDKDAQGAAVCGISTNNPNDGRKLSLTYTIGGSDLTVTADKASWSIPDGTALDASMQIDQNAPWPAHAAGHGTSVAWIVPAASIRSFDGQFRDGGAMVVAYPSGNEMPWTVSLTGSTAASATLWRCVQDLSDRAHLTAPASNTPPATQPFGQAPTQPYTPPETKAPITTQPVGGTPPPATKP